MAELILLGILVTWFAFLRLSGNPAGHSEEFRRRRVLNWLPMGLTYAFLYMGRYNLTVAKTAFGDLMKNHDFGLIFMAGTVTYALAFLINGPLTDKMGGKKAILAGALGSAVMNLAMGIVTYYVRAKQATFEMVPVFIVLYALNMYFQSFGAVAIVKVNSHWFHVRERGSFGGIFGTLISLGIYFAFDWGGAIVKATQRGLDSAWFGIHVQGQFTTSQHLLRKLLGAEGTTHDQTYWVFFIPAVLLLIMFVVEFFLLKDRPEQAGHRDFDTGDASSGEMDEAFSYRRLFKRILTNPIIITVAAIEFCSGVLRNGVMHWYLIYLKQLGIGASTVSVELQQLANGEWLVKLIGASKGFFFADNWGLLLCVAGVYGGMSAGFISDKLFGSRRGPSAALLYAAMVVFTVGMIFTLKLNYVLGLTVILMSFCVIGVHGMLSGTATMDFGGRKGAATAVGVIDGFVYLGTGLQSISLGYITEVGWRWWPVFLAPFAVIGLALSIRIWRAFPDAKRKGK